MEVDFPNIIYYLFMYSYDWFLFDLRWIISDERNEEQTDQQTSQIHQSLLQEIKHTEANKSEIHPFATTIQRHEW